MSKSVAAVVLGSRGGDRLARALDSVAWAAERVVLDPAHRLDGERLPISVVRSTELSDGPARWLLVLEEHEVVSTALAAAIVRVVNAEHGGAYRIPQHVQAGGTALGLRGAPLRLACRRGARLRVGALGLEIQPGERSRVRRLQSPLMTTAASSIGVAIEELEADASALAALLHARQVVPRLYDVVVASFVLGVRVLAARGPIGALWPRWGLAVLSGYRVVVAYAKLWELKRLMGR
jgi:hypothetical protein